VCAAARGKSTAMFAAAPTRPESGRNLGLRPTPSPKDPMLYTIAVVLLILWVLGLVSSYTIGGFIHILLVVAVVMVLVNLLSGRKVL